MNAFLAEGFLGLQLPGDFDPREFKFKTSYFLLLNTTALSWFRVWLLLHARFLLFGFAAWLRYGTITAEFTFSLSYCFKRWHTNDVKWWRYETVKGAWWRHQLRLSYYFHGVGYNGLPFLLPLSFSVFLFKSALLWLLN